MHFTTLCTLEITEFEVTEKHKALSTTRHQGQAIITPPPFNKV